MHMTREIASLGFLSPPYRVYTTRIINYTSIPETMLPHNWPRGNGNKTNWMPKYCKKVDQI